MITKLKPLPILYPLSVIYGAITSCRNWLYESKLISCYSPHIKTICVGNLILGGSGKTPFCDYLAQKLIEKGKRPVILSRGYGGKLTGPHLVYKNDNTQAVGDEAILHFNQVGGKGQVVVSRQRTEGIKLIEKENLGDLVVLDDGLQHRAIKCNLNLLLVDISNPERQEIWQKGKLLPAGYLREKKAEILKRVEIIIFVKKGSERIVGQEKYLLNEVPPELPIFIINIEATGLRDVYSGEVFPVDLLKGEKIYLLSALAEPRSFKEMISSFGGIIKKEFYFPDHHYYKHDEWKEIRASTNDKIITTAKDAVKLKNYLGRSSELYELLVDVKFPSDSEENNFWNVIYSRLEI